MHHRIHLPSHKMGGMNRKPIITYNSAKRYRKRCGMPKPLPLGEVSAQQTERASRLSQSRCAAIGRLFVRAILLLCKSCLAASLPSQALRASSPRGGAFRRPKGFVLVQPLSLTPFDSSPSRGASGETVHFAGTAKASPTRSNGDDRRQWRKQGGAVGAAASRMRAEAKQTLGAATRAVAARQR